jgi:hypothetical protein
MTIRTGVAERGGDRIPGLDANDANSFVHRKKRFAAMRPDIVQKLQLANGTKESQRGNSFPLQVQGGAIGKLPCVLDKLRY